jgi:hypothetical protein
MRSEEVLFHERQRLPTIGLALLVVVGVGVPVYIGAQQLLLGKPFRNHPISNRAVAILLPSIVIPILLLARLNLETRLYPDRLRIRFFPLADDDLPIARIVQWEVRNYSASKEFMGWGVRSGDGNTAAYSMRGRRGVQLLLDDESHVLIGSLDPERLVAALTAAKSQARLR